MFLFEDVAHKEVVSFNESIDAREFLQEMVTTQYTGENLTFAKTLQEALEEESLVELNESDRIELAREVILMENRLEEMKEICSLNEGFGIVSWWKLHALGSDKSLGVKVQKKLESVKTEEQKAELLRDLQKVKKTAQTLNGTKDSNKGDFWKDFSTEFKAELANRLVGKLGIIPMIIRLIRSYDGTNDDFIKGIDVLIKDVKSIKVAK